MSYSGRVLIAVVAGCLAVWAASIAGAMTLWNGWGRDGPLFLVFSVLQLLDYELTTGILHRGGRELNPLVRWLIDHLGNWGLVLAKLVAVALGYVLAYHGETALLAAGCVLYVGIIAWNWRKTSAA